MDSYDSHLLTRTSLEEKTDAETRARRPAPPTNMTAASIQTHLRIDGPCTLLFRIKNQRI
jgi:hypothetical protein